MHKRRRRRLLSSLCVCVISGALVLQVYRYGGRSGKEDNGGHLSSYLPSTTTAYTSQLSSSSVSLLMNGTVVQTIIESKEKQEPSSSSSLSSSPPIRYYNHTFWSSDFHISPIADVKDLLRKFPATRGATVIDESLSGHCHIVQPNATCYKNLKVLNRQNGIRLEPCANQVKRDFYDAYINDQRMHQVDAFLCQHALGLCEVYMALDKPLIAIASTRYEIGRLSRQQWQRLNDNLRAIAANRRNTIAANNRYDAEYVKHFTGLSNVKVLPNICAYTGVTYNAASRLDDFFRPEILIGPSRLSRGGELLARQLQQQAASIATATNNNNVTMTTTTKFAKIRDLYPHFQYADLVAHRAIVLIPYQVSVMSLFEYYRMGIPLFVPSLDLLVTWQLQHLVMDEVSWNCVVASRRRKQKNDCPPGRSWIDAHPDSPHFRFDPNNQTSAASLRHWLPYADFYQWPHITTFDNWNELMEKVHATNFQRVHNGMMAYNRRQLAQLERDWMDILQRAFGDNPPRRQMPQTFQNNRSWEEAMLQHYPTVAKHVVHAKC